MCSWCLLNPSPTLRVTLERAEDVATQLLLLCLSSQAVLAQSIIQIFINQLIYAKQGSGCQWSQEQSPPWNKQQLPCVAALHDAKISHLLVKASEMKRVFRQFLSPVWLQARDLVGAHPHTRWNKPLAGGVTVTVVFSGTIHWHLPADCRRVNRAPCTSPSAAAPPVLCSICSGGRALILLPLPLPPEGP